MSDFRGWSDEPAIRSMHAAPQSVADVYRKAERRLMILKRIFWFAVFIGICVAAIWVILQ